MKIILRLYIGRKQAPVYRGGGDNRYLYNTPLIMKTELVIFLPVLAATDRRITATN